MKGEPRDPIADGGVQMGLNAFRRPDCDGKWNKLANSVTRPCSVIIERFMDKSEVTLSSERNCVASSTSRKLKKQNENTQLQNSTIRRRPGKSLNGRKLLNLEDLSSVVPDTTSLYISNDGTRERQSDVTNSNAVQNRENILVGSKRKKTTKFWTYV